MSDRNLSSPSRVIITQGLDKGGNIVGSIGGKMFMYDGRLLPELVVVRLYRELFAQRAMLMECG